MVFAVQFVCTLCLTAVTVVVEAQSETKEISKGVYMPFVNAGHPDDGTQEAAQAKLWFQNGGTGIDTAYDYHNQNQVGQAIKESGLNRTSFFITTKISPSVCSKQTALSAVQEDLKELGLSYVDLLLHHFPCNIVKETTEVWKGLEEAKAEGLARAIGVSNFKEADIDAVAAMGGTVPAVNQCRMSVGSHDDSMIAYCASIGVTYQA